MHLCFLMVTYHLIKLPQTLSIFACHMSSSSHQISPKLAKTHWPQDFNLLRGCVDVQLSDHATPLSPLPPVHHPFFPPSYPECNANLSRLRRAIKRHRSGEGGLACSRNCAVTRSRGSRDSSPLRWDLKPQREREVSTEDKGSIEENRQETPLNRAGFVREGDK